jgi:hypothetical protein
MTRSDSGHEEGQSRREPPRQSASAVAAALRWDEAHPEGAQAPPPGAADRPSTPLRPGDRHSASAEAAALRWRERHEDDEEG